MKFPRLGSPKTIKITEKSLFETTETEITTASQWDFLPTWAQYTYMILLVIPVLIITIYEVLK